MVSSKIDDKSNSVEATCVWCVRGEGETEDLSGSRVSSPLTLVTTILSEWIGVGLKRLNPNTVAVLITVRAMVCDAQVICSVASIVVHV